MDSPYSYVKEQIKYLTGKYPITCPNCKKSATAKVSKLHKARPRSYREVKTSCRHCKSIVSFLWYTG